MMLELPIWTPEKIALIITSSTSLLAIGIPIYLKKWERKSQVSQSILQEIKDLIFVIIEDVQNEVSVRSLNKNVHERYQRGELDASVANSLLVEGDGNSNISILRLRVIGEANGIDVTPAMRALAHYYVIEHDKLTNSAMADPQYGSKRLEAENEVMKELSLIWKAAQSKFG